MALFRVGTAAGPRLAVGPWDEGPVELLDEGLTLGSLLAKPGAFARVAARRTGQPVPEQAQLLSPLDSQEVWAAGVTYPRSRDARMSESITGECYDLVYAADRPELFFKALGQAVRGPGESVGIRHDSTWDVPEPELAVVVEAGGEIVAYTLGNDVSSRSIEGENPLYLPQAKVYDESCAVGPCLVGVEEAPDPADMMLALRIARAGVDIVSLSANVATIRRGPAELVEWLLRARSFDDGVVLLTGTSIVPDDSFTLQPGDEVTVSIDGLGVLTNRVRTVPADAGSPVKAG